MNSYYHALLRMSDQTTSSANQTDNDGLGTSWRPPDPQRPDDLESLVRALAARVEVLNVQVSDLRAEVATLDERLEEVESKNKKLPFFKSFTSDETDRIVKVRADYFYNASAKQGQPKHNLRVFCWLNSKKGLRGSIDPWNFWLKEQGTGSLKGNLTHKGGRNRASVKGTEVVRDHIALITGPGRLMLILGNWLQRFTEYQELPVKPNSPIARWYWNRPDGDKGASQTDGRIE